MTPEARLFNLASQHHGLVTSEDARRIVGKHRLQTLKRRGVLTIVHRGVLAVNRVRPTQHSRVAAAVLARLPDGHASHATALWLWGLAEGPPARVDVLTTRRGLAPLDGVTTHYTKQLPQADRSKQDGIAVTSVGRTLVDVAPTLGQDELTLLIDRGLRLGVLDPEKVGWAADRLDGGRRALGALRAALGERPPGSQRTDSECGGVRWVIGSGRAAAVVKS